MGILLAFIAMFSWGVGDFLIQKSTRRLSTPFKRFRAFLTRNNDERYSTWIVLFYICGFGTLVLTPFVWREIGLLSMREVGFLSLVGVVMLGAALFDFRALKIGKISVVEHHHSD
jgi:drug/metabolite transporter (DMT)-like permease